MLLSKKICIPISDNYSHIIGHMCYSAYKLWNICNYERLHYKELQISEYPNWYYQKKHHNNDIWYKYLPSQTAQEICKILDKSWKSFYSNYELKKIRNPHPPHYKNHPIPITYMQMGIKHTFGSSVVRLTLSKQLKEYMSSTFDINEEYLYLENKVFQSINQIKQLKLYLPRRNTLEVIIIYDIEDATPLPDNHHYLSIDLGLHNLMTCYDSYGRSFIVGRKYLSICRYFDKQIAKEQSKFDTYQFSKGLVCSKRPKKIKRLYLKKQNCKKDYLHKITKYIVSYCVNENIHQVIIGDLSGILKNNNSGHVLNQQLFSFPYNIIYRMLEYKLALKGISLSIQNEAYSSQCSPTCIKVSKQYANKDHRIHRGLFYDSKTIWNADSVGAYNILRLNKGLDVIHNSNGLSNPKVIKVAV